MKNFFLFLLFLAGIALVVVCGFNHVVQSPHGIHLISKSEFSFHQIYTDVSHWGVADFLREPRFEEAMLNREIPDFNNLRLKLATLEGTAQVGQSITEGAKAGGRKIAETSRELNRKYELEEKAEALKEGAARATEDAAKKLKGWLNR